MDKSAIYPQRSHEVSEASENVCVGIPLGKSVYRNRTWANKLNFVMRTNFLSLLHSFVTFDNSLPQLWSGERNFGFFNACYVL